MSKLAVYDKHDSIKDFRKNNYFRHDYVYKMNMSLRFFVLIGAVIIALFYLLHKLAINNIDIFEIDIQGEIKVVLIIAAILLVLYTILGTIKFNLDYEHTMKRIKRYQALLNLLDKSEIPAEGGTAKKAEPKSRRGAEKR